jgi:hypothetical protein
MARPRIDPALHKVKVQINMTRDHERRLREMAVLTGLKMNTILESGLARELARMEEHYGVGQNTRSE